MKKIWALLVLVAVLAVLVGCTSSEGYELIRYSVKTTTEGQGTVQVTPQQDTFVKGEKVIFTAKPEDGWIFDKWTWGDPEQTSVQNPLNLTINSNLVLKAHFISANESFTLKIQYVGEGTVEVSPSKPRYLRGEQVTLRAHPADYWLFSHWDVDATGSDNPITITMDKSKTVTAVFSYDIGQINFTDDDLEKAVRDRINKPIGPIRIEDVVSLNDLNASHVPLETLNGLEYLTALTDLNLSQTSTGDIAVLKSLTAMRRLRLAQNQIADISPLTPMKELEQLDLSTNQVTDVGTLIWFWYKNMTRLDLSNNSISSVGPLAGLTKLTDLSLASNKINDVNPLADLINLQKLDLGNNQITTIEALKKLKLLENLNLSYNSFTNIDDLLWIWDGILRELNASGNQITDINALFGLTKLEKIQLNNNQIAEISVLAGLPNVQELDLSNNKVVDISTLSRMKKLAKVYLHNNNITNIAPLLDLLPQAGVPVLKEVSLTGNPLNGAANAVITELRNRGVNVIN